MIPMEIATHENSKSKTTQAIKLFSEGKTPVDVVVALDLQPDDVQGIYQEFLKLQNMHELVSVFDEIQNHLSSFLELFRIFHARGLEKIALLSR
jgi:hypothetical protein